MLVRNRPDQKTGRAVFGPGHCLEDLPIMPGRAKLQADFVYPKPAISDQKYSGHFSGWDTLRTETVVLRWPKPVKVFKFWAGPGDRA